MIRFRFTIVQREAKGARLGRRETMMKGIKEEDHLILSLVFIY